MRRRTHKYDQLTPLNRLVDVARPESTTAREFAAFVQKIDQNAIQACLERWRANDAKLEPTIEKSFLLEEDAPISKDLSRMASIGLEALDHIRRGRHPTKKWISEQRAFWNRRERLAWSSALPSRRPFKSWWKRPGAVRVRLTFFARPCCCRLAAVLIARLWWIFQPPGSVAFQVASDRRKARWRSAGRPRFDQRLVIDADDGSSLCDRFADRAAIGDLAVDAHRPASAR